MSLTKKINILPHSFFFFVETILPHSLFCNFVLLKIIIENIGLHCRPICIGFNPIENMIYLKNSKFEHLHCVKNYIQWRGCNSS